MRKIFFICISLMSIIFSSCTNTVNEPTAVSSTSTKTTKSLSKMSGWNTSDSLSWPQARRWVDAIDGHPAGYYYYAAPTYSFSSLSYNFYLEYSSELITTYSNGFPYSVFNHTISVTVNDTYCSDITWTSYAGGDDGTPSHRWSDWYTIYYQGSIIQIRIYIHNYGFEMVRRENPLAVQIQTPIYALDEVTNFTCSPETISNTGQSITLSWDSSSDTDVTGYEITAHYFKMVNNSYLGDGYLKVTHIDGRTINTWTDSGINWNTYKAVQYNIKAVSSTRNVESGATICYSVYQGYEDYTPW